jgi:hypothetical protein
MKFDFMTQEVETLTYISPLSETWIHGGQIDVPGKLCSVQRFNI